MLLQDAHKPVTYDPKASLSFEGETGPYLQYTYARCQSIIDKSSLSHDPDYSQLTQEKELQIIRLLSQFGDAVKKSAREYKPNYIARYVLDLAHLFNSYYHHTKIIGQPQQASRLALVQAVQNIIKQGLKLLAIDTPNQM